jgi:nucleoside 2-deoxyribosyltransferase
MINEADFVVAEVTNPSLGVGYELAYAEKIGKPIACLFDNSSDRKLSAMVSGNSYNKIINYRADAIPNDAIAAFLTAN